MIEDSTYAYGCTWMKKHVNKLQDLWDHTTKDWKQNDGMRLTLGRSFSLSRKEEIITAIPNTWRMNQSPPFTMTEWVMEYPAQPDAIIYQMDGLHTGKPFYRTHLNFFSDKLDEELQDLTRKELRQARVITCGGDLISTKINPVHIFSSRI